MALLRLNWVRRKVYSNATTYFRCEVFTLTSFKVGSVKLEFVYPLYDFLKNNTFTNNVLLFVANNVRFLVNVIMFP